VVKFKYDKTVLKDCHEADLNGAINIAKKFERWMSYMPIHGAECEPALNQPVLEAPCDSEG